MDKIPFEDGTLVKAGYVEIDGTKHETVQPEYTGKTPLSAYNLIKMQDNVENAINDGDLVRKIKISGASKQETREGYNKLPPMVETTTTFQGRTYTSNGKGSLSVTGSATGSGATAFDLEKEIILGKENLYVHLLNNYATGAVGIRFLNGNTRVFEIVPTSANMITDIGTTYAGQTITAIQIYQNGSNNFDMTIQPMICTSNSSLEFEQYGASPSIEHEAPIESVGDNINLIDINSLIEGYVKDGGECSTTSQYGEMRSDFLKVKPNTQYTFKIHETSGKEVSWIGIGEYSSNEISSYILRNVYSPSKYVENASYTITTSNTTQYVIVSSRNLIGATKIKFEEGQATPYSPYGQGSVEIKQVNENLYDGKNETGGINADGSLATATDRWRTTNFIDVRNYKEIEIKCFNITTTDNLGRYYLYDENHNVLSNSTFTIKTVIDVSNASYIKFWCLNAQVPNTTKIQVGINITDYVEHQSQTKALYTQQPFRAIGDVKDRFVKKAGVWYEEHNIARKILNGSETTWYLTVSNEAYCFWFRNNTIENCLLAKHKKYCNYFQYEETGFETATNPSLCENSASYNEHNFMFVFKTDGTLGKTVDEWKAKLTELYNTGTPVYVDYVLETPILIPCTPEQVAVLNDIYSAYGEGMTNIICNDEIEPVIEIVKETKETVQSENDKAISALLARVTQLEQLLAKNTAVEEGT